MTMATGRLPGEDKVNLLHPEPTGPIPSQLMVWLPVPVNPSVNLLMEPSHSNPEMTLLTIPWAPHLAFSASIPPLPLKPQ